MAMPARLAADIGGTFTDVVLETDDDRWAAKVLTTPRAPERAVLEGIATVLATSGVTAGDVALFVHGTTLATNAVIERRGARTALLCTEGFRDAVEMAQENRFEQYDVFMDKPEPLVARPLRLGIAERLSARGDVLVPLDEDAVRSTARELAAAGVESIAVGYLHSYRDPSHELRTRELLAEVAPGLSVTLSSEVCPEIREYERLSTACINAYVQPLMARYLRALERELRALGLGCPIFLMQSNGGLCTLDLAVAQPVRLIESGPAGGAILAAHVAAECGLDRVLSFDMGGTTAKICLVDDGRARTSRSFEVARVYRFLKGSGLPLRIPVVELVEIGAGGGSIASVDALGKVAVGPHSAGSEPGPACYGRGGMKPTVTDADVVLGRLDPAAFAGGTIPLDEAAASATVEAAVAGPLGLDPVLAAYGISEMVTENMAAAARVHAVEAGKDPADYTVVAFGGAAPLHAARLAQKLGIGRVVVPRAAGVGSAVGFLRAPIGYEIVRTRYQRLDDFDLAAMNELLAGVRADALAVVRAAAGSAAVTERLRADMRYVGQGHEIVVELPLPPFGDDAAELLRSAFEAAYRALFTRTLRGLDVEVLTWTVSISTAVDPPLHHADPVAVEPPAPSATRPLFDPGAGAWLQASVWRRDDLPPGTIVAGPAIVEEDQTTVVVAPSFTLRVHGSGALVLESDRSPQPGGLTP